MTRPRMLDLYCGAGGAGMGYHRAGFDVVGVDIAPQPNYPFEFHQGDAIEYAERHGHEFDAVHSSPPCQTYSRMSNCRPGLADEYPDLVGPTRVALDSVDRPYVIENVVGSPVRPDVMLCGWTFGRELYRHRVFESNVPLWQPAHIAHVKLGCRAGHWEPGRIISVSGNCAPVALAREVMEIDWTNSHELAESIPPYFSQFVGHQLAAYVMARPELSLFERAA